MASCWSALGGEGLSRSVAAKRESSTRVLEITGLPRFFLKKSAADDVVREIGLDRTAGCQPLVLGCNLLTAKQCRLEK